ncbi:unnamed protein product [Heterobilharzia americana]|nr:unnamed protein product [Heterobilharzia americana]
METDLQQTTNYSGEKGIRHYSNVETESQLIAEKTPSLLMLTLSNSKLVHDELVDNGSKKIVRTPLKESKDLSIEQTSKFNDAFQKYAQESQVSLNEVSEDLKAVRITSYLLLNQRTEPTYLLEETDENEGFKISTPNILHRKTDVSESQMYTGKKSNQALQNPLANKSSIPDNSEGKTVDSKEIVQSQTVFTNAFSRTVETEETTTVSIAYSDQKLRDHENRQYELKQSTDGENGMHYQELPGLFMESQQTVILDSYQTNCQTQTESSIKTEQCVEPILSTESNKSVPVSVSITSSQVDQSDATDDCSQLQGQDHFPYIVYKQDENKTHRYSLDKFITIEISTEKSVSNEPIDKPVLDAKFDGEIRKPYFNETQLSQKHLAKISSDENNFKREIKEFLSKQEQNIIIEHESDEKYSSDVNTLQVIETHTPEPQKPSLTNISLNSSRKGILSSVVSTNSFVVRSITETPSTLPVHFRGLNIEMERVHSTRSETSIHSHSTPSPILVPEDQLGSFLPVTKEPDLTNFTPLILPARNLKTSEAMDTETDASKKEVQPSIVQTVIPVSPEVNTSETSIFIQKTDMSKKLESMSSESSDHLVSNQKADLVPPTYDKDFVSNMSTSKILHSHRFVELTISDTHLHEVNPSEIPPVVVNKEFKSFSVQNNEGIIDDIKNAITSQFKGPVESLDWCISEETRNGTQLYVNDPPFKILKDPELPSTPVSTTPENTQFTPINVPTLEAVDSMKVLNDSVKDELYQQTVDTKADVFGNLSQVEVSISMEHTDNMNRLDFVHSVESNKYTDPEYIPPLSLEIDDQELTCLPPKISFKETHFKSVEVPTEKPQVVTVPTIQPYHIKQESTPSLVPLNLLINLTKCNIGVTNSLEQNQLKEAVDSVSSHRVPKTQRTVN